MIQSLGRENAPGGKDEAQHSTEQWKTPVKHSKGGELVKHQEKRAVALFLAEHPFRCDPSMPWKMCVLPIHESSPSVRAVRHNSVPPSPAGLSSVLSLSCCRSWKRSQEANLGFIAAWEQLLRRPTAFLHLLFALHMEITISFYLVHDELLKKKYGIY